MTPERCLEAVDVFCTTKGGTAVLIIDPQNDFHSGGSLAVVGADRDTERVATMIANNKQHISQICVTLDSHAKLHISHAAFWEDADGNAPPAYTKICVEDVEQNKWKPKKMELNAYCLAYLRKLREQKLYQHIIWPDHCLIGTTGQCVVDTLTTTLSEWETTQLDAVQYVQKGMHPLTEMYSCFQASVWMLNSEQTWFNRELMNQLLKADRVLICGQALSHCVNYSIRDLMVHWPKHRMKDLVLVRDTSSPVAGFEKNGEGFVQFMKDNGCLVVTSHEAFTERCTTLPLYPEKSPRA